MFAKHTAKWTRKLLISPSYNLRIITIPRCSFIDCLLTKYTDEEKDNILQVINNSDLNALSSYDIDKVNLKKISKFRINNGQLNSLQDIEYVDGFSKKTATKLFDSILNGPSDGGISSRIKGQFLQPTLNQAAIEKCESVLSVYVTVNSVCWTLVNKDNYEVREWKYYGIQYPDNKKCQITDILNIAWRIVQHLPLADLYVMKAEATTLRAGGSDPNNPKVLTVNLQKSQMISMLVALLSARSNEIHTTNVESDRNEEVNGNNFEHNVYFLRPNLPYRVYGTLVGNEQVSTDHTVQILLNEFTEISSNNSHAYVPKQLRDMFCSQKDLQKDMLGHCLLLCLTFMDLCIYKNKERIVKLLKR